METHFAPAAGVDEQQLAFEIELVSRNPILSGVLHNVGGMLAVINERRQVIAYNDSFLETMGINDPHAYLGLRPGQILQCVHVDDAPAGCGTAKVCATCGAAIAIVTSINQEIPAERICALSATRNGKTIDIALLVRSHPVRIETKLFLMLFLQDITQEQQQAALARTFFHDVNNMLCMLVGASELLFTNNPSELGRTVFNTSVRLQREVEIQRCLTIDGTGSYKPMRHETPLDEIAAELRSFFFNHPSSQGKVLEISCSSESISISTDIALLLRVLCNMIINAFEATGEGGVVKLWFEYEDISLSFCVWNDKHIPEQVAERIFQRNFSTKDQKGRGIGTYSMKLFGEKFLNGIVRFTTSRADGTTFILTLPRPRKIEEIAG